ncbi:MAG TPA: ankyrin repeat domain-containing protein [Abditibacteriaceae bacterium]|jgi:ankyrin repeat protein
MNSFKYILISIVLIVSVGCGAWYWNSKHHKKLDTEMIDAARTGDDGAVRSLIAKGANIEVNAQEGAFQTPTTPLMTAVFQGHERVVKVLLESGADANHIPAGGSGTALGEAAAAGHDKIVQLLLDKGANVELGVPEKKVTPLMMAAWRGRASTVRLLLAKRANPKAKNTSGETALDYAYKLLRLRPSLWEKDQHPHETTQILKQIQIKGQ